MHFASTFISLVALGRLADTAAVPRAAGGQTDQRFPGPGGRGSPGPNEHGPPRPSDQGYPRPSDQEHPRPGDQGPPRPNNEGFPTPSEEQLSRIEKTANGLLPNGPPPRKLEETSLTAFQLVAFNEQFEVAFFSSLLQNVSSRVAGYDMGSGPRVARMVDILKTVVAQEELHAIEAQNVLKRFGAFVPTPCRYRFGTTSIREAIALASTFTDVVLGTLQDASQLLAKNGDAGPVRTVASVIGQEGEQNGYYRSMLGRKPSAQPFLTTSAAPFAYSALQAFVVPGSCASTLSQIRIPIFTPLHVVSGKGGQAVQPRDQQLNFTADLTDVRSAEPFVGGNGDGLYVTYLTGQQLPVSVPISSVRWDGGWLRFEATFPYMEHQMDGLSIAALTKSRDFSAPDDVPAATLAAPGLIEVFEIVSRSERNAVPSLEEDPGPEP